MHQGKKGNQWYFGMKAHIGVDEYSGLVHSVVGTSANVADVTQVDKLLHGDENVVCVIWQIAARRSTYQKLGQRNVLYKPKRKIEKPRRRSERRLSTRSG
jgi:IS5 family transposase